MQLNQLWGNPPLNAIARNVFLPNPERVPHVFPIKVGDFPFVPLVTNLFLATAELEIVLLRPEPPGNLITQGGDIDNRLKTLFDSLTMPQLNALPQGIQPKPEQIPYFFCLLHDDNLITSVSVKTAQLLEPMTDKNEVELYISVRTRTQILTYGNAHLT